MMTSKNHDRSSAPAGVEHIYLLNRVSLDDYLAFMGSYPVDAQSYDRALLSTEWRQARDTMDRLRRTEGKWADNPPVQPLPSAMQALVENVEADPIFRQAFSDAPYDFGLVELDRIVVSQKLVASKHLDRLRDQLGPRPSPADLFRFCLPYDHPVLPHRGGRVDDDTFSFISDSADLRFLDAVLLRPDQISGYQANGPIAGVVGLVVGYGSNFLNVVRAEGRLILSNGHHRACALRKMGITHVPMVIQSAAIAEELEVLAPRAVRRDPDFYLTQPRPPVLKDYFDSRLSRLVDLAMSAKEVRVSYSTEEMEIP